MTTPNEVWAAGNGYQPYIGRWSRLVAREFLAWLAAPAAGEMQLIRQFWDVAVALDARAGPLDEGRRFPICRPPALEVLFRTAGLNSVESRAIDVPTRFRDFSDYWTPFLGGQGPGPGYAASLTEDERARMK